MSTYVILNTFENLIIFTLWRYRSDSEKSNGIPPTPSNPTSPTEKLTMEIDATFTHQMSEVDTILLPPNPVQFLEPSKLKRRESRKLSFKKSKKTDRPYALRKGSFKKYRQDSLNQGTWRNKISICKVGKYVTYRLF